MAINFVDGVLLTGEMLNTAFSTTLDLTQTAPQQMSGNLTVPQVNAVLSLSTQSLNASGNVTFSGSSALQLPGGNTLQRPNAPQFGMMRWNSDSGVFEVNLPSGLWANVVTSAATQVPSSLPTNMSAPAFGQASGNSVPLGWVAPGGGTPPFSYTVSYRPTGTTNFTTWATNLLTTVTTVSGLLPATRYDFNVTAYNAAGNTTSPVSSTNTLGYLAGGPANVSLFAPTSTTMSISWTSIVSAVPVSYKINYAAVGQSTWHSVDPISMTSYTVTSLLPNTTYNFQVVALTTGGSYESTVVIGTTAAIATVAPNAPGTPTLSGLTPSSVNVAWSAPTIGTSPFAYNVELQVGSNPWITNAFPETTANSMNITQLTSGQLFNVRVQAINSAGSAISTAVPVTPTAGVASVGSVVGFQQSNYSNAPFLRGPQVGTVYTNASLDITGCSCLDASAAYLPGTLTLSVNCGAGHITMHDSLGNQMLGSGSTSIQQVPLTYQSVQAALGSLSYTAPATATADTVNITITDQLAVSATISINLSVITPVGSVTPSPPPSGPPTPTPSPTPSGSQTSTGQPTDVIGIAATPMVRPLYFFGVGISPEVISYGGFSSSNAAATENAINYIGNGNLHYVRCNVSANMSTTAEQQYLAQVAQNCGGMQYLMALDVDLLGNFSWQGVLDGIVTFARNYGYVDSILGVQNAGGAFTTNANNRFLASSFQANVNSAAQQIGAGTYAWTTYYNYGTPPNELNPYTDYGYAYSFPGSSPNTVIASGLTPVPNYDLQRAISLSQHQARQSAYAGTEFGWNSFSDTGAPLATYNYVAETAQASYLLTYLFSNFASSGSLVQNDGNSTSSGICVWADLFNNSSSYYGNNLGLFTAPGGYPTRAAQALRFTYQLLFDTSINAFNFEPGTLNYTRTPDTIISSGLHDLLFQKNDGTFILVIWNEQVLNNSSTNALLNVPAITARIEFGSAAMASVSYYNPLLLSSGTGPGQALNVWTNVTGLTIPVPPNPIYLLIKHG